MIRQFKKDSITGFWSPALSPSDDAIDNSSVPEEIMTIYSKLKSQIDAKYTREYLKVCAYYNKMFPSLKDNNWNRSSYNAQPFTAMDQERSDTGTGISTNYLKQIVMQVVSRLGTVNFEPVVLADTPTLEYIIYKDELERILRQCIRKNDLNRLATECFHDAAILGYSHILLDPITHQLRKVNDWELGYFEPELNQHCLRHLLYRCLAFPTSELEPYVSLCDDERLEEVANHCESCHAVDFKLYFDCVAHEMTCIIDGITLWQKPYQFDQVQLITFAWDVGMTAAMSTSLFDLLYPVQRELNKVLAKMQQLIRIYKGPVPVFSGINDVDPVMKQITNGSGECLYLDNPKDVASLMTVINPTPLDPALSAEATARKTEMYELAGIQQMSLDMENFRSASAMIAMDQTRDATFQVQLAALSRFIKDVMIMYLRTTVFIQNGMNDAIDGLISDANIDVKPIHMNDPLGHKGSEEGASEPNYNIQAIARYVVEVAKGASFSDMPYELDVNSVKALVAQTKMKVSALNLDAPGLDNWLVEAFVDDIVQGVWSL